MNQGGRVPRSFIALAIVCATVTACGREEAAPAPEVVQGAAPDRKQRFAWDEAAQAFTFRGKPLAAGRLWTFEDATDGFVGAHSSVAMVERAGLRVMQTAPDPYLRSPDSLHLHGSRYSLVLVRLSRVKSGGRWDGALSYRTADHAESAGFQTKPLRDVRPQVGETMINPYDMARLNQGGDDWTRSYIEQLRLDLDADPGGEFVIRQIAVVENPGSEALGPAAVRDAPVAPTPKP